MGALGAHGVSLAIPAGSAAAPRLPAMSQMSQAGGAPPGPVRRTPPSAPPRRSTPASTPGSSATPFARCSPLVAAAHQPKPSFARCCNRTSARESDARGFPFPRQNNAVYPPSTRVSVLCHAERRTVTPSWTSVAFLRIPALSHGPHLADRVRGCADRKAVRLRRRYCRHAEAAQPSPYPGATCLPWVHFTLDPPRIWALCCPPACALPS